MKKSYVRVGIAVALVLTIVGAGVLAKFAADDLGRTHVTAYFANSNGVYSGDEVRILGVPVGKIETITPEPDDVKVTFWLSRNYKVPADVKAVVLSPTLVTARAIQLTPPYSRGPQLPDQAVIPKERTAVPVEYDEVRQQLERLTQTLQPTTPGGVSTLGSFVETSAENLRGQGPSIHDTLIKLSQALSAVGDHSKDTFSTVKNVSVLVSALQNSADLLRHLNQNLANVSGLLVNRPNEVGRAVSDLDSVVGDVQSFLAENTEATGTAVDKLASVTTAVQQSIDDVKQLLHSGPNSFRNFVNIYQPAQGTLTGILALNNFANPITFLCGAIEAASRLGGQQAAKLCVQYLAPIIKNRQYNFFPLGENLFVGATARPNERTYSEDWMRPDFIPPPPATTPGAVAPASPPPPAGGIAPPQVVATDPANGLQGMMAPAGGKP